MIFDGMLMETIKVKGMVVKDLERTIAVVGKRPVRCVVIAMHRNGNLIIIPYSRTIVLGTAPVQNAPTFFSLLLKHYPSVIRLVVRSKRCTPLEPNVPVYIVKPGEGIQHIELELQEAGNYTAMRKIKSKERQVVRELRLRESAACMPWMVSRRHELGLVLQVYRGVEYLALDFGLNPSALEPYSKTAFRGLRDDTLPDLVSLKLRFEPALQPSPAPQDLFFRKWRYVLHNAVYIRTESCSANSSALFIRLSKLQHVQIIFRNDPRSRKVRLRNEIHATTTWTHECPTFPYSRKKALGLLFPSPEKVEAYIQDLVHWSRSLRTFHVAYTDKNRPNDAHPPLDLRFVIRHGRVVCRRAIYDTSRLLDLLPVSDDILLGRYNQAENKTLLRNWIQEGATQEERDERHNIRWLEYNRRQARANAWLASQTSGV